MRAALKSTFLAPTVQPVTNVATRGRMHVQLQGTSGSNTRFKGRLYYRTGINPVSQIQLAFANWYLNVLGTIESAGPNDVIISKVALEYNGKTVPVYYSGQRSFTVVAGTAIQLTDPVSALAFGVSSIPPNSDVWVRILHDMTAGQSFPSWGRFSFPSAISDVGYRYDPANGSDDVDSTGTMAVPAGQDGTKPEPFAPVGMFGRYTKPTKSLFVLGDSIVTKTLDQLSQGNGGGCWVRRGCWTAGVAAFLMTVSGGTSAQWISGSAKRKAYLPYFTDALNELGFNDIGASVNPIANNRTIWSDLRAGGLRRIYQSKTTIRTTSTDHFTTAGNQTPFTGYTNGGERDTTNASYASDVGVRIDGLLDVSSPLQDGTNAYVWAARSFTSTLAANYTAGGFTLSLNDAPSIGEYLLLQSSGVFDTQMGSSVLSVSGSGPYTVGVSLAYASNHSTNDPVLANPTGDGTHPNNLVHAAMAASQAAFFSGLAQ